MLKTDNTLHVIGVVSNPVRYKSRYRIYEKWRAHMKSFHNVKLHIVEASFGDRVENCQADLNLKINQDIWIKENMINLGVRHLLPSDWKYMAWVDADVFFRDPNWVSETLHQLQHYPVVQPWSDCIDLGPTGNILQHFRSFCHQVQKGLAKVSPYQYYYAYAHPGFAWACRRDFWENIQGMLEIGILGSGDYHMAYGMIGNIELTVNKKFSQNYLNLCKEWQRKAMQITHGHIGYVSGRIEHEFHGPKNRRYYIERAQILIDNQYDPIKDLMHDSQGVSRLVGKPKLQDAIHKYNLSRCEDSIDES